MTTAATTVQHRRAVERQHDAEQIAALIRQAHPDDQAAMAYDHASHGCPLEDDAVTCPVCTPLTLAPDCATEDA